MESNETLASPTIKKTRSSFIEEAPPTIVKQPATPPAIQIPATSAPPATGVRSPQLPSSPSLPNLDNKRALVADLVPDLHGLLPKKGLSTELNTHDAVVSREAVTAAENKPIPPAAYTMPGSFALLHNKSRIPEWYRTGWTSTGRGKTMEDWIPSFLYGEWYHHGSALFLTALVSYILAKINAGVGTLILFCLCIGKQLLFFFSFIVLAHNKKHLIIVQVQKDFAETHVTIYKGKSPNSNWRPMRNQLNG